MKRYYMVFLIFVLALMPTIAQDDEEVASPFTRMLEQTPLVEQNLNALTYYSDLRAAVAGRPGLPPVTNYQQVYALGGGAMPPLFLRSLPDNFATLSFATYLLTTTPIEFRDTNGFDLLAIEQTLFIESFPDQVMLFAGNFDTDAVSEALINKDYVVQDTELLVLCPDIGCDEGSRIDPPNRDATFVFGGVLGQRFPILLTEDFIGASPSLQAFMTIRARAEGRGFSLMDVPAIAAIANYLEDNATLVRQVTFVPATVLRFEEIPSAPDDLAFGVLPQPGYFALVDAPTPDAEETHIILTYEDAETAESALEELLARYEVVPSTVAEDTLFNDLVEARDAEFVGGVVSEQEGQALVVLTFSNAHPANTPDDGGFIRQSAFTFNLLQQSLFRFDVLWFAPSLEVAD